MLTELEPSKIKAPEHHEDVPGHCVIGTMVRDDMMTSSEHHTARKYLIFNLPNREIHSFDFMLNRRVFLVGFHGIQLLFVTISLGFDESDIAFQLLAGSLIFGNEIFFFLNGSVEAFDFSFEFLNLYGDCRNAQV